MYIDFFIGGLIIGGVCYWLGFMASRDSVRGHINEIKELTKEVQTIIEVNRILIEENSKIIERMKAKYDG